MSVVGATGTDGERPRVVVVGAGFAGINAVHGLRHADVDITIVDKNNFNTFQPLLYQVSTAYLAPEEISETVRSIFRRQSNVEFRVAEVTGVDWSSGKLSTADGEPLDFDYLVLSSGARANFFGIAGMDEHAWPLYTLSEAVALRIHLLRELERTAASPDGSHRSTVVVVGGGPTGVEMAGALAAMGSEFIGGGVSLRVVLVEALPRLLNAFSDRSAGRAVHDLEKRGVELMVGTTVASVDPHGVDMADGTRIETETVVWAAGVQASPLGAALGLDTGKGGAIVVDDHLQVPGRPNVFAAGDTATVVPPPSGSPLPGLAPVAIQGGRHVAQQIRRLVDGKQTKPFHYRDKGILAVIGKANAVAEIPTPFKKTLRLGGIPAWLLWVGVHVVYLIGFRNRLKVLVSWGWSYFTSKGAGGVLVAPARRE